MPRVKPYHHQCTVLLSTGVLFTMHKRFDRQLSLAIDAIHVELERIKALPNTPRKIAKLILLRCKLRLLERRIPA